jgi:hypothetical protein
MSIVLAPQGTPAPAGRNDLALSKLLLVTSTQSQHFAPVGLWPLLNDLLQTLRPAGTDARARLFMVSCSERIPAQHARPHLNKNPSRQKSLDGPRPRLHSVRTEHRAWTVLPQLPTRTF